MTTQIAAIRVSYLICRAQCRVKIKVPAKVGEVSFPFPHTPTPTHRAQEPPTSTSSSPRLCSMIHSIPRLRWARGLPSHPPNALPARGGTSDSSPCPETLGVHVRATLSVPSQGPAEGRGEGGEASLWG